jgi:hypothetical protein
MTALPFGFDQAVETRNSFLSDGAQPPVALVQSFGCGFTALERGFDPREQVRHLHVPWPSRTIRHRLSRKTPNRQDSFDLFLDSLS